MKQRLTNESKVEADVHSEEVVQQAAGQSLEFESAESLIRYDAALTMVPPHLRERVLQDVAKEKAGAPLPWWKRWFRS